MKKHLLLICFTVLSIACVSQTTFYTSLTNDKYWQISVTMDGTEATYSIQEIEENAEITGNGTYIATDQIIVNENGEFDIPNEGENFWFISFASGGVVDLKNCTTGTRVCACRAGDGSCKDKPPFCKNGTCNECIAWCEFSGGEAGSIEGGGVLIYATAIRLE